MIRIYPLRMPFLSWGTFTECPFFIFSYPASALQQADFQIQFEIIHPVFTL